MKDFLEHTRPGFDLERVIAGPDRFFAISRYNLAMGPIRHTLAEAEADADRLYDLCKGMDPRLIGWGAVR